MFGVYRAHTGFESIASGATLPNAWRFFDCERGAGRFALGILGQQAPSFMAGKNPVRTASAL